MLASFASDPARSKGRLYAEEESAHRSPFQRDRDRIIHASAFRRLKHKTQVFIEHEGDYFRTRLTHSIEVAQVARTLAGTLGLNQELTEAVALAHDLGHTPFGHTGEDALAALMAPYGGFDHNAQALRIVTNLERHYAEFDGLNLTWESLEGIAKHNGPVTGDPETGELPYALAEYNARHDLELDTYASAEAQVAALSDDIAYNSHDLHDGLRAELFSTDELAELPLLDDCFARVDAKYPDLNYYRRRHEALRRFFGVLVEDVIAQSNLLLAEINPKSVEDIRAAGQPMIQFSDPVWRDLKVIRKFLFVRMYRAPSVVRMREKVTRMIDELFPLFMAQPDLLPKQWRKEIAEAKDETTLARIVADYISGMTDRFAIQEHQRLIGGVKPDNIVTGRVKLKD
ncbi:MULTISPECIES: deoxyguanosinetriphosphate triphosphohydrolase [Halocynthiibacter]|uniref:Deoxyguanosinetriphosphate triphosphohydrolase-like protein n=1 Tax=Halocynthiibacter halioticoli TaxID=2986804 RepID=A0AAE3IY27_9RHOB|nr:MULTISPECIES: deoxyguanosinetriphosphate triphosphohydrolase [Halocynthiibacter]MCV6824223.1 deoxyguanosinetriphosphate triphosphohydrolase [Halocynthiibacter halioticoli]MCW4057224.1 deoxyguanosinetriphosphate triphosphohydrolase [Halocynthiibacter sp. SDUM655004]